MNISGMHPGQVTSEPAEPAKPAETPAESRPEAASRARDVLIAAVLILLPGVVLAGAWRLGGASALEDDLLYYLPIRQYVGERIAAGEWPLWNPLVGMGTSVAADPQSGLWYPFTVLFVLLPATIAYPTTLILHFALAGWGMYRLCRASGRDWQAAFLAAIAFEFCGFLVAHRVHLTMHHAVAWIPWMLYGWRRLADSGRGKYFALAAGAFGLQMLVQHTQISIMSAVLLTAHVGVVLWPACRSLAWQYPLGMVIGACIGAVQTVPTLMQLGATGRGLPTYAMFVENSWAPTSALMLLFPMIFGNRTPGIWGQSWWGLSHFCEQFAYGSIVILVLALASWRLIRAGDEATADAGLSRTDRREIRFWWAASLVALIVALGELSPISRLLFCIPIYRSVRTPARWILVWSVAMPILASAVVSTVRRGGPVGRQMSSAVRWIGTRLLPGLALAGLLVLVVARWRVNDLDAAFGQYWGVRTVLHGLRSGLHVSNPGIFFPIIMMAASVAVLARWTKRRDNISFVLVVALVIADLASIAAFVDVDRVTYRGTALAESELAATIRAFEPDPGHRLLVPRYQADYERPLEVLWPQTNMLHGVPTFNAYGPFWPRANRLLFRFMPWGSSEAMLELLRNRPLCAAMGVRFLAARTSEEQGILAAAAAPRGTESPPSIPGTGSWRDVLPEQDLVWPIRIDEPGIYELRFDAKAGTDPASQCFVRLETPDLRQVGFPRRLEPVDLSQKRREMRLLFVCSERIGEAAIRIKSVTGHSMSVRNGAFGLIAAEPEIGAASRPVDVGGPVLRATTSEGVRLFELTGAVPLVRIAATTRPVPDLGTAVAGLLAEKSSAWLPDGAIYEWDPKWGGPPEMGGEGVVQIQRPTAELVRITVDCPGPALLVFNETADPGWSGTLNGQPARVLRVNGVVQGLIVPRGGSQVVLHYQPAGLRLGMGVSLLGLITLVSVTAALRGARHQRLATPYKEGP